MAIARMWPWEFLEGVVRFLLASAGWNHQWQYLHTHRRARSLTDTNIPSVVNTGAQACATPRSMLWHTDWLILWWACLWHTDCATLQQERPPPPPPSPLPPSLPAPPCIYAVFSREALAHLPPSSSSTTSAPSYSGGWQWGWGANEKGQDEDVWRAQGDDLTQFWGNVDVINVGVFFVFTCLQTIIFIS